VSSTQRSAVAWTGSLFSNLPGRYDTATFADLKRLSIPILKGRKEGKRKKETPKPHINILLVGVVRLNTLVSLGLGNLPLKDGGRLTQDAIAGGVGGQRECWLVSQEMETQVKARRKDFLPQTSMLRRFQERGGRERKKKRREKSTGTVTYYGGLPHLPFHLQRYSFYHDGTIGRLVARKRWRTSNGNMYGFGTALDIIRPTVSHLTTRIAPILL